MSWVALSRKLASTSLTKMGGAASFAPPDAIWEPQLVLDPRGGAGLASGCFALDDHSEGPRPATARRLVILLAILAAGVSTTDASSTSAGARSLPLDGHFSDQTCRAPCVAQRS